MKWMTKRILVTATMTGALSVLGMATGGAAHAEPSFDGTEVGDIAYSEWGGPNTVGQWRWDGSNWDLMMCYYVAR